jgi:hypothetical protein
MNVYTFEVIGDKRENLNNKPERKEDGFPIKNIELLMGAWNCRGPLTGGNLAKYLGNELRSKEVPGEGAKVLQYDYDVGQWQVYRTEFSLESADIQDVIAFLGRQRQMASPTEKNTLEEFTSHVIPMFEAALGWLQASEDGSSDKTGNHRSSIYWRYVRLTTKYFG